MCVSRFLNLLLCAANQSHARVAVVAVAAVCTLSNTDVQFAAFIRPQ